MRKRKKLVSAIFFLTLSLSFVGCTATKQSENTKGNPQQAVDIEKEKKAIKDTLINIWDAIEKGEIERYSTYIHPNFTQFGETAKVLRVGKDAQVKAINEGVEEPTKVHTEMKDEIINVTGDTAWITYYWEDGGTSKGKPFATKGKSTRIFVKENGKWLCIHGHYTLLEDEKQ